jgi:hypothetical protein
MIRTSVIVGSFFMSALALACPGAKCDDKGNCARCAEHKAEKKGEEHGCKDKAGGKFCHEDAAKICGKDVLKNHDKIHVCLLANKDKISKECAKHLETEKH